MEAGAGGGGETCQSVGAVMNRRAARKKTVSRKKTVAGRSEGGLLAKYHRQLRGQLRKKGRKGPFLYRGQESAIWPLRSSAARRLYKSEVFAEGQPIDIDTLVRYHEENLLKPASLRGWRRDFDGRSLGDLELLAKLRHYGAAVVLLDFTTRFDVALWFACQESKEKGSGERDGKKPGDGQVFVVDAQAAREDANSRMGDIEAGDLSAGVDVVLDPGKLWESQLKRQSERGDKGKAAEGVKNGVDKEPKFWYWESETLVGRMLSQESRFLFGPNDIPEGDFLFDIGVDEGDKDGLLWELEQQQGLRPETVF